MNQRHAALATVVTLVLAMQTGCVSSDKMAPRYKNDPEAVVRLAQQARERCAARGFPAAEPTEPFLTDGCTGWSDDVIHECCIVHDMEYWCGGSREDRRQADSRLHECVEAVYGEWPGPILGWIMEVGVTAGGSPTLPLYWRWGYGHEYGEGGYTEDTESDDS